MKENGRLWATKIILFIHGLVFTMSDSILLSEIWYFCSNESTFSFRYCLACTVGISL